MNKLLIATRNQGKLKEFKNFFSDLPLELVSLCDLKISEDVEEDGKTYAENSKKKALFYAKLSGLSTIADDGGIEIEALGGMPGARTRRWLGYEMTDKEIINHLTKVAKELPDNNRMAYFKTVVTLGLPDERIFQELGELRGIIAKDPGLKLLEGYPFRSFFYIPEIKKFYHEDELSEGEQKLYNHRYKAVQKLKPIIKKEIC